MAEELQIDNSKVTYDTDIDYTKANIDKIHCNIWGVIDSLIYTIEQIQSDIIKIQARLDVLEGK